jgi:hypothetical protein
MLVAEQRARGKALVHDRQGFAVVDDQGRAAKWPWANVIRAEVSKRDLLTTDLVCLSLELAGGSSVEVHEELEGWQSFVASLPENLPGFPVIEHWFSTVTHPAFKTNLTTIYERTNAAG